MENNSHAPGLFGSARGLFRTTLATMQNRIELFSVELKEQKYHLMTLLLLAGATLVIGLVAVLTITATVIYLLPQDYRLYGFAGFSALYVIGVIGLFAALRSSLKKSATPFEETISELRKDREWLRNLN